MYGYHSVNEVAHRPFAADGEAHATAGCFIDVRGIQRDGMYAVSEKESLCASPPPCPRASCRTALMGQYGPCQATQLASRFALNAAIPSAASALDAVRAKAAAPASA